MKELRDVYTGTVIRDIARDLKRAQSSSPDRCVVADALKGPAPLSLTGRTAHIAAAMRTHLPQDFAEAAQRLRQFQKDPAPVVALLEMLKDDPELYVRRSVNNSLNDTAKDHPAVAIDTCRRWMKDASPGRAWIVGPAL